MVVCANFCSAVPKHRKENSESDFVFLSLTLCAVKIHGQSYRQGKYCHEEKVADQIGME